MFFHRHICVFKLKTERINLCWDKHTLRSDFNIYIIDPYYNLLTSRPFCLNHVIPLSPEETKQNCTPVICLTFISTYFGHQHNTGSSSIRVSFLY